MGEKKYEVYVYQGSTKVVSFADDVPFMAFHVGDTLNPTFWGVDMIPGLAYKILQIEHMIHADEGPIQHVIFLYTEVKDVAEDGVDLEDF